MLRDAIHTDSQLKALVEALRETLTLGRCADLIDKHVTDPAIREQLDRVVGAKAGQPMKYRKARELAAAVLGFENVHTMARNYRDQDEAGQPQDSTRTLCQLLHVHPTGEVTHLVVSDRRWTELGVLDVIGPLKIHYKPLREETVDLFYEADLVGDLVPADGANMEIDDQMGCLVLHGTEAIGEMTNIHRLAVDQDEESALARVVDEMASLRQDADTGNFQFLTPACERGLEFFGVPMDAASDDQRLFDALFGKARFLEGMIERVDRERGVAVRVDPEGRILVVALLARANKDLSR